jgi:hypothetical protein
VFEDAKDIADWEEGRSRGYVITELESTVSEYDAVLLLDVLALELASAESLDLGFFDPLASLWAPTLSSLALFSDGTGGLGEA